MGKPKLRFREPIFSVLRRSSKPLALSQLADELFGSGKKIPRQNLEKGLERELRELVKARQLDRLPGNYFRIRIEKEQKKNTKSGKGLIGKVSKNPRGFAFVALEGHPEIKEDIFLPVEEASDLMTGDRVMISLAPGRSSSKGPSGKLIKIIQRGLEDAVGVYYPGDFDGPYAILTNRESEIKILLEREATFRGLKEGSAVLIHITHHPLGNQPARGKIQTVLADSLDSTTDDVHILTKHKLRTNFSEAVIRESQEVSQQITREDLVGRHDLRSLPFVTIDGADARDFDDAVCAERLPRGGFKLWVAIADVAHYVRPGSELDKEAYERGTSTYFPHRVLPMLPERLSNGICSLNPHEDRLAMICEMDFDAEGNKKHHKFYEGVFQSKKRCVYEDLQKFIDDPQTFAREYPHQTQESIFALFDLYKLVQAQRFGRGAIDLELPESKVVLGEKGEVTTIKRIQRLDTHRLIEEFMIAANESVSEIMEEKNRDFIFRVHETPEPEAFQRFLSVAQSFGISPSSNKAKAPDSLITPYFYQTLANAIKDSTSARVLHFQLLRSMKQAYYSHENLMHFGLASKAYSHFTSPIRRYPDLIVHRLLKASIHRSKQEAEQAPGSLTKSLAAAALHCSQRERLSAEAEREMIRIKQVRYAEAHIGQEFKGRISGVTAKGVFVEMEEVSLEGFVPQERLGHNLFFDDKSLTLETRSGGKRYRLGDPLQVQIVRTNVHQLLIELEPLGTNGQIKRDSSAPNHAESSRSQPDRKQNLQKLQQRLQARKGNMKRENGQQRAKGQGQSKGFQRKHKGKHK